MVPPHMTLEIRVRCKRCMTLQAFVRFFVAMNSRMVHQTCRGSKSFLAHSALKRLLSGMRPFVGGQMRQLSEAFLALSALVRFVAAVQPIMAREGRSISKTLGAFLAFVGLLACVKSHMAVEMTRLSKSFSAYRARVRFLSSVASLMNSQVRFADETPAALGAFEVSFLVVAYLVFT